MFRRVHRAIDTENLLRSRDPHVVHPRVAVVPEPGPQACAGKHREHETARAAVEIDAQRRTKPGDGAAKKAPALRQHRDCRRTPPRIAAPLRCRSAGRDEPAAESPAPASSARNLRASAAGQLRPARRRGSARAPAHYSFRASSTSITGMSSRIGKTSRHAGQRNPFSSCSNSTGVLQTGQTRISKSSLLTAISWFLSLAGLRIFEASSATEPRAPASGLRSLLLTGCLAAGLHFLARRGDHRQILPWRVPRSDRTGLP